MICLNLRHFYSAKIIADKISTIFKFSDKLLFHVSRGVRLDSDHVVILNEEMKSVAEEIVRAGVLDRVNIALDFLYASLNRVGDYIIGIRSTLKNFLIALLEPTERLREFEEAGNNFARLALLEELKTMLFGAVWDYYCLKNEVPVAEDRIQDVQRYEKKELSKRLLVHYNISSFKTFALMICLI